MSKLKLLPREGLVSRAVKAATGTRKAQDENHLVLLSCAAFIVGDDDEAREEGIKAALAWFNGMGVNNKAARSASVWMTTHFRIGIDRNTEGFQKIRFKPNSKKVDDFAAADAMPYWQSEAKAESDDEEATRPGVAEVRAEFARFLKKMDAINNGNATDAAKKLARKARNFVAEC